MDIPSRLEGRLFYNTFTKLLWVILQPFFYTLRPVLVRPKPITRLEVINFTVQVPLLDIYTVTAMLTLSCVSVKYSW